MGTSGAYGGSPGWNDTRTNTGAWLDTQPSQGGTGVDNGGSDQEEDPLVTVPDNNPMPVDNPVLNDLLRRVALRLSQAIQSTDSSEDGRTGGGATIVGGGGVRGRRRAAVSGGVAIAGVYGLRNGVAESVSDAGLSYADLTALTPFEQARLIVDAASFGTALIEEAELREVNANFVCWTIEQEEAPSPVELVKQWVTEYVFRVWLTEAGDLLRNGSRDGESTHALEQEARVTLEARVAGMDLAVDGLRASHFESAIRSLLSMLGRIFR